MRIGVIGAVTGAVLLGSFGARADTAAPNAVFSSDGGFFERLLAAYEEGLDAPTQPASTSIDVSGCLAGPLDSPPFPGQDFSFGGNPGMCQDGHADRGPLMKALTPTSFGKWMDDHRIVMYGWVAPGFNASSSQGKNANSPGSYYYTANTILLDQATLYLERLPDTLQTDHVDWGFRVTNIYGSDYRYTTMYGINSGALLKHNNQNGWDIPMAYGDLYVPDIGYGTNFRMGRYISLPDIEAQLAPDNYMYSHSILYSSDPYTQIGLVSTTKLDPKGQWEIQFGLSGGNDVTPWAGHNLAQPTLTFGLRYTTPSDKDNLYFAVNSVNDGKFGYNNLQSYYFTWYHVFPNQKFHTAFETWYMYQKDVPKTDGGLAMPFVGAGGTHYGYGVNGPYGAYCKTGNQCNAFEYAFLNYTEYEFNRHDSIGVRQEVYNDARGQRTGYQTMYYDAAIGWNHYFSEDIYIRPEITYYHSFAAAAFDNGKKHDQVVAASDIIIRY